MPFPITSRTPSRGASSSTAPPATGPELALAGASAAFAPPCGRGKVRWTARSSSVRGSRTAAGTAGSRSPVGYGARGW